MSVAIRRILVPVDFSETSLKAIEYVQRFAQLDDGEILLLHVLEYPVLYGASVATIYEDDMEAAARRTLAELLESVKVRYKKTSMELVIGSAFAEIVRHAARHDILDFLRENSPLGVCDDGIGGVLMIRSRVSVDVAGLFQEFGRDSNVAVSMFSVI